MKKTKEVACPAPSEAACKPLRIVIPCDNHELGRSALQAAAKMAGDLEATVTLVTVNVVPFPLPLERPDVDTEHILHDLRIMSYGSPIPVRVLIVLARDKQTAIQRLIPTGSLVVLATRKRWWRTAEEALARALRRDGHRVILLTVDAGGSVYGKDGLRVHTDIPSCGLREREVNRA